MAQHRGFTRKKLIEAVGQEHMRRYFVEHMQVSPTNGEFTEEAVASMIESQDAFLQKSIDEELACINDVAEKGMDYLDRACKEFGLGYDDEWPRERVSMNLFLENPSAFRTAYDWYLYRTSSNSLSHHQFTGVTATVNSATLESLRSSIEGWYAGQAKGKLCQVRHHKDDDADVLIIAHGDYPQSQTVWDEGAVKTAIYRPAKEDILRFTPDNAVLSVKLAGRSNLQRHHYIEAFGKQILGLDEVPLEAFENTTVSVEPIRSGGFDYCEWGKGAIEWVQLVQVDLEFPGIKAHVVLSAPDVRETVRNDLTDLRLTNATLKAVKLRYKLNYDGAPSRPIPVEVRPPQRTIVNRKRDAHVIEEHLRENGVLLV